MSSTSDDAAALAALMRGPGASAVFIDPDPSTTNTFGTGATTSRELPPEGLPPGVPPSPHPADTSASNVTTVHSANQYRLLSATPTSYTVFSVPSKSTDQMKVTVTPKLETASQR